MNNPKNAADILRETIETLFATSDVSCLATHPGMEALSKNFIKIKTAFPDIKTELQQQLLYENKVASHWVLSGTHLGDFFGIQPTGKTVQFQNLSIAQVEDGKIIQYNSELGWLSILMQIGALPLQSREPNR